MTPLRKSRNSARVASRLTPSAARLIRRKVSASSMDCTRIWAISPVGRRMRKSETLSDVPEAKVPVPYTPSR